MPHKHTHKTGFTLLELSIVIVIIGLIVGGILVGRDLIESANLRKSLSTIESINTAINTFRLKYNCLPGDCITATALGLGANGDGNGVIFSSATELSYFWDHLYAANLITQPIVLFSARSGIPITAGSGSVLFGIELSTPNPTTSWLMIGKPDPAVTICGSSHCTSLTPLQAKYFDDKIDDTRPATGRVLAIGPLEDTPVNNPPFQLVLDGAVTSGPINDGVSCINTPAPHIYNNLNSNLPLCAIAIQINK